MLFKAAVLKEVKAGRIALAFRRWTRPTVRTGGTLRTAVGVLAIEEVRETSEDDLSEQDAIRAGFPSREALLADLRKRSEGAIYRVAFRPSGSDPRDALRTRDQVDGDELAEIEALLDRLDRAARTGAWAVKCLRLVGERDGRTAAELAESLGLDKAWTKRRIRQLKELGLTESLQSGYRLSNRGRALLNVLTERH